MRKPQRERNGALLRVHAEVCVKKCLTPPTLLEMAMFRQLRPNSHEVGLFRAAIVSTTDQPSG